MYYQLHIIKVNYARVYIISGNKEPGLFVYIATHFSFYLSTLIITVITFRKCNYHHYCCLVHVPKTILWKIPFYIEGNRNQYYRR